MSVVLHGDRCPWVVMLQASPSPPSLVAFESEDDDDDDNDDDDASDDDGDASSFVEMST